MFIVHINRHVKFYSINSQNFLKQPPKQARVDVTFMMISLSTDVRCCWRQCSTINCEGTVL